MKLLNGRNGTSCDVWCHTRSPRTLGRRVRGDRIAKRLEGGCDQPIIPFSSAIVKTLNQVIVHLLQKVYHVRLAFGVKKVNHKGDINRTNSQCWKRCAKGSDDCLLKRAARCRFVRHCVRNLNRDELIAMRHEVSRHRDGCNNENSIDDLQSALRQRRCACNACEPADESHLPAVLSWVLACLHSASDRDAV